MGLRMASPYKHPKTGVYYLRKRIPVAARHLYSGTHVTKSLKTKDPQEAKRRARQVEAEWDREWRRRLSAPQRLTGAQIEGIAGEIYKELPWFLDADPGDESLWLNLKRFVENDSPDVLEIRFGPSVDIQLSKFGLKPDDESRRLLLEAARRATLQRVDNLLQRSRGDYRPDPDKDRFPAPPSIDDQGPGDENTLLALFEVWRKDYAASGKEKVSTVDDWRRAVARFEEFSGQLAVSEITGKKVIEWCDWLRAEHRVSVGTVKSKYLAALRSIFKNAQGRFLVDSDPTTGVRLRPDRKAQSRSKGFSDSEACSILKAALKAPESDTRHAPKLKLAFRWLPWLCAYTGARAGEIAQLRKRDVLEEGGVYLLRITPEAGAVKNRMHRQVPLHPHLIEQGFLRFVESAPPGHLFFNGDEDERQQRQADNVRDKVSKWIRRSAGIDHSDVQPNHAWRHRFKTVAREAGIPPDYIDAIQGHSRGTAGEAYGEYPPKALLREIEKLPRYPV